MPTTLHLLARRTSMPLQPGGKLPRLLRSQVHAVVHPLQRLLERAFSRGNVVRGEEIFDLVPHSGVAEGIGSPHNLGAGERATGLLDLGPMQADEIPTYFLARPIV